MTLEAVRNESGGSRSMFDKGPAVGYTYRLLMAGPGTFP